ncbi:hypothetical protein N7495_000603 [Penicillium taxi]|uniref:uncharacterized protein n=1 Tax=Penicillium taxi TaxID=168475 RepID=UPI00254597D7|nr:uncharacterized protein N7495_000603 [Penicillium taxi]KAJ5907921.1 hypothetical protein N7495_000603 [Penicillium taxi]
MSRQARRARNQLFCFLGILCFIIYLNRPQSQDKTFSWTKVQYKTTAEKLPEARGICPKLSGTKKPALVVSHVAADGDKAWLNKLAKKYHLCVYEVDAKLNQKSIYLQVPANRGHETITYLTFLIDNYADFPEHGAVFVHGSRYAWHNDHPEYDNLALLTALDVPAAQEPRGYYNLRCDWSTSTCLPKVAAQGSLEMRLQSVVEPWSARAASDIALPRALANIFGGDEASHGSNLHLGRTETVKAQCCGQFVISRARAWQHTREEYVALRQWLLDGTDKAAPADDRVAGRILSYIWHIMFTEPNAADQIHLGQLNNDACPSAKDCYCRLYGRCDLECSNPGTCSGQYRVPQDYKLPDDWEATHKHEA